MARWTAEGLWDIRELAASMNDPPCVMDDYLMEGSGWVCVDDDEVGEFAEFYVRWD